MKDQFGNIPQGGEHSKKRLAVFLSINVSVEPHVADSHCTSNAQTRVITDQKSASNNGVKMEDIMAF